MDNNTITILLDIFSTHNYPKVVILLSQTCRILYERVIISIKNLLVYYNIHYENQTLRDCFEIVQIEQVLDFLNPEEYFNRCILYNRDHRIEEVLNDIKYDKIFTLCDLNDVDISICESDDHDIMKQVQAEMQNYVNDLLIKAYNNSMNVIDAITKAGFYGHEDITTNLIRYYSDNNNTGIIEDLIMLSPWSQDIYDGCTNEDVFSLMYEGYFIKPDVRNIAIKENDLLIECVMKYCSHKLKKNLIIQLLARDKLRESIMKFINNKIGFVEYIGEDRIYYIMAGENDRVLSDIYKYGGLRDKIVMIEIALEEGYDKYVLDILLKFDDKISEISREKGDSRRVCKKLLKNLYQLLE